MSNPIYFSYLLVIIDFVFISAFLKLGLFFQNTTYDIPHTQYEINWVCFFNLTTNLPREITVFPISWGEHEDHEEIIIHHSSIIIYLGHFRPEAEKAPPIIGPTCAFESKNYKNVDAVFDVSLYLVWNKKLFQISNFCFQLQAVLVEIPQQ